MNKAVLLLLTVANALLSMDANKENEELKNAINALDALGEDAKGTNTEYKELKYIIDGIDPDAIEKAKAEAKAQKADEAKGIKVKHLLEGDFYIGTHLIGLTVPNEVLEDEELNARFERALDLGILEKA